MQKLIFISTILLLCGCNPEFQSPDGENGKSVPLSISGLHLEGSLNEENEPAVTTRAVTLGTVTTDGAIIKVFQLATNGYMGEYNVKCTYTDSDGDGAFQWELAKFIGIDKRVSSIVGVYDPNGLGVFPDGNTGTETSVNLTAQVFDEAQLWYLDTSHTNVTNTSPAVAFKMAPAYSRIKLSIQRHANYVGDCAITNVNLKSGTSFYSDNSMNISSGAVQGNATDGGWTYPLSTGNIAAGAINTAYDVLVPPQSVSSGLIITLTIDGVNRVVTIPATQFTNSALAAGQQYTIPLMITDTAVTPSGNVAITDYATDGTTIKNDTPTEL